ncbi:MAG: CAP domain-containing protein [Xenococcaceae cyanobacterium]
MDLFNLVFGIPSPSNAGTQIVPTNGRSPVVTTTHREDRSRSLVAPSNREFESEVFDLVNEHRQSIGLQPLARMRVLDEIALPHTRYMFQANLVSHDNYKTRFQHILDLGFPSHAENCAGGECYPWEIEEAIDSVVPRWLQSPKHREAIETPEFTHSGFALLIAQHQEMPDRVVFFAIQVFAAF